MIIDMHVHSSASDDAAAEVEGYLKWINFLRKSYRIDGLVFTEHRKYDRKADYSLLEREHNLLILHGIEAETDWGHFLLYGALEELACRFDFSLPQLKARELLKEVARLGGIAVPAHPGRRLIGLCDYERELEGLEEIWVIEVFNGSSKPAENLRAQELADKRGYWGIGGSDAHYVSAVGACLTEFEASFQNVNQLVEELRKGRYRPIRLEEARVKSS